MPKGLKALLCLFSYVFRPFGERSAVAPLVLPLAALWAYIADERSKKEGETLLCLKALYMPKGLKGIPSCFFV